MNKIITILIIGLILVTSPVIGNDSSEGEEPFSIVLFTPKILDEFSQWHALSKSTDLWLNAISAGLYDISYEEESSDYYRYYHENIAQDYPTFINNTTLQVKIKDNIRFSHGELLTVEDVVFSYQVALSPAINKKSYNLYSKYFDSNDSIVIVDDNTIEFRLNQPYLFYLELLTLNIIPKSTFQEEIDNDTYNWNDESGKYAIGAGPYRIEQINLDKGEIILLKNTYNNIWSESDGDLRRDYFDRIIIKYAETKELAIQLSMEEYRYTGYPIFDPNYRFTEYDLHLLDGQHRIRNTLPEPSKLIEIAYNHLHPILGTGVNISIIDESDKLNMARDIRKAISLGIYRDDIEDTFIFDGSEQICGFGIPTTFFKPKISTTGFIVQEIYERGRDWSTDKAKNMMTSIGFNYSHLKTDDSGRYISSFFNVSLTILNNTMFTIIADSIKSDLRKIGIGISPIISLSTNDYDSILYNSEPLMPFDNGGFDMILQVIDWGLLFNPTLYYHSEALLPMGKNIYNFNNSELDEIISNYTRSYDYSDVNRTYHQIVDNVKSHEISTPLYFKIYNLFSIDGLRFEPIDVDTFHLNWEDVYINFVAPPVYIDTSRNYFFDNLFFMIPVIFQYWKRKRSK